MFIPATTSDTARDIVIRNCDFYNTSYAVYLSGDADPSRITWSDVSGNYFYGCKYGVFLDCVNNCTVSNNRMVNITGGSYGILLDDVTNCTITGNTINCVNGVDERGTCDYNMYIGNNCRMCTTDYDINCVTYFPYPAANFSIMNIGTWT